jgi:YVTN family beta-propeller protein
MMNLLNSEACRRRRWPGRLAVVAAGLLAGAGLAVPAALATPGALSFAGCNGDTAGCVPTLPSGALTGADAVVVTPDGRQVYTAAPGPGDFNAVSHFTVGSSGNLTFAGCYGNMTGCAFVSPSVLAGADALAVTPDGANLYVTSADVNAVDHFTVDSGGNLTFAGCYGEAAGCTAVRPVNAMNKPFGVAVTPDGQNLYVSARGAVDHFTVDSAGNLTFAGFNSDGPTGGAFGALAVTPDGAHLYVASSVTNSVSHFVIDSAGNLAYAGCIGDTSECTATSPSGALDGVDSLAVTPDGTSLYVAAGQANAASRLAIDPAGNLGFAGCIGDLAGCATTSPSGALDGASAVAMTSDGANVYVTGFNAVSHFTVDAHANLVYAGCTGDQAGCASVSPSGALHGISGVAVTGDGAQLYATSANGYDVSHFTIGGFTTAGPPPVISKPRPCLFACPTPLPVISKPVPCLFCHPTVAPPGTRILLRD